MVRTVIVIVAGAINLMAMTSRSSFALSLRVDHATALVANIVSVSFKIEASALYFVVFRCVIIAKLAKSINNSCFSLGFSFVSGSQGTTLVLA